MLEQGKEIKVKKRLNSDLQDFKVFEQSSARPGWDMVDHVQ